MPSLLTLCTLVDEFWNPDADAGRRLQLATEIRLRGEQFGLSPTARARLGWKIAPAPVRTNTRLGPDAPDPRTLLGSQTNVLPFERRGQ